MNIKYQIVNGGSQNLFQNYVVSAFLGGTNKSDFFEEIFSTTLWAGAVLGTKSFWTHSNMELTFAGSLYFLDHRLGASINGELFGGNYEGALSYNSIDLALGMQWQVGPQESLFLFLQSGIKLPIKKESNFIYYGLSPESDYKQPAFTEANGPETPAELNDYYSNEPAYFWSGGIQLYFSKRKPETLELSLH